MGNFASLADSGSRYPAIAAAFDRLYYLEQTCERQLLAMAARRPLRPVKAVYAQELADMVPVPPYDFAQWDLHVAQAAADWMLARGLIPAPGLTHELFREGAWRFADAVTSARAEQAPHPSETWPIDLIR